ncbi:MAG: twin-arginine translocase subunit TatC [Thermodesulfobacteriota bacterium]
MPDAPQTEQKKTQEGEMGFLDHLDELRKSITKCAIAAFLGMLACYAFAKQLFTWLMLPLFEAFPEGSSMIYTAPHEAFFTYIKTAFLAGIFLTSPYIFYQLWLFVKPGLYSNERKYIFPISFCSALLFICGSTFGYFIIFPYAYKFFMGFANINIEPMISMREGFSFSFRLLLAFGVVFELPLVIFFLARLGLVSSRKLRKVRKYSILVAFILSAMLTPPDVFTQTFMAGPLIILYEVGIWIAYFFGRKEPEREKKKQKKARSQTSDV